MMYRRQFIQLAAALPAVASLQQKKQQDDVDAGATEDTSPRVGIVLSSFSGGEDHDGSKVAGLPKPCAVDAQLTDAQLDAMVRKAIELGTTKKGGLVSIIAPEDWVVIKPDISTCYGLGPETKDGGAHTQYVQGSVTDLRIVRSLITFLAENKLGARITIAEGSAEWLPRARSKSAVDGWTTDWGGAFGGLSYQKMVDEFSRKFPAIKFEIIDLNFDTAVDVPVSVKALASRNRQETYSIPKTIQQCDKMISVSPLKTHPKMGVSLAVGNYLGIAPGAKYGFPKSQLEALGEPDELAVDLFGYHPADYAVVGGSWGLSNGKGLHHNLVLAGVNAVAVDAVAATAMGFDPAAIRHLKFAERMGHGTCNPDEIWMRGNEVEQARRSFRQTGAPAKTTRK